MEAVEYKVVAVSIPMSETIINREWAANSWRLVQVVPHLKFYYYYFERPYIEQA